LQALDEAITIVLKEGDSLFVPSYTWMQIEWLEMGITVSHFGWVNALDPLTMTAVVSMNETWKHFLYYFQNLRPVDAEHVARTILSTGRHPRGASLFAGAPVCYNLSPVC
jgi:hypothetical protein